MLEAQTFVKKLGDESLAQFDHDYVSDAGYAAICARIDHDFPAGAFTFLDVGGGKGLFTDRLLESYQGARAVVLDNADLLLGANAAHARKDLVLGSATDLAALFPSQRFDVAFFNFALHHFIGKDYADTRRLQRESVRQARTMLVPGGRVSVSEITYNGALVDNLPSRVVFGLTASAALAPLVKRLGANTAGTGVCFMSAKAWQREFSAAGLAVEALTREPQPARSLRARVRLACVTAGNVSNAHFWLRPS